MAFLSYLKFCMIFFVKCLFSQVGLCGLEFHDRAASGTLPDVRCLAGVSAAQRRVLPAEGCFVEEVAEQGVASAAGLEVESAVEVEEAFEPGLEEACWSQPDTQNQIDDALEAKIKMCTKK